VKVWAKSARSEEDTEAWLDVQLKLLRMERHPNIMLPHRIREDETSFYVEFDAVLVGTSMLQMIVNEASITDQQVRRMMRGIFKGLSHLHKHGLAHRDIKPENILLDWHGITPEMLAKHAKPPNGWRSSKHGVRAWRMPVRFKTAWTRHALRAKVRIIDLDTVDDGDTGVICGTPGYMAPEAYLENAGVQGDLFGAGLVLYLLFRVDAPCHEAVFGVLAGQALEEVPERRRERVVEAVKGALLNIDWEDKPWDGVPGACELCMRLLDENPDERGADAASVLKKDPWLQKPVAGASLSQRGRAAATAAR